MKTRIVLATCLLALTAGQSIAQTNTARQRATIETQGDSILIRKGSGDLHIKVYEGQTEEGETKKVQIYDGVYVEQIEMEHRTFVEALPFVFKKKRQNSYEPHTAGLYIGFASLSNNFLTFGSSTRLPLDLSQSWEFGINLLSTCHNFRQNPHWGVNIGLTWGYRSFNFDGNIALLKEDGRTFVSESSEDAVYTKSRLRHFFFRIPLTLEWQQKVKNNPLFFNFGPEFEIRHGVKSFAHVNGGKKQTVGKGMYARPVGVNLLVQAGYGDLGVYLRYSTYGLFQKGKGMDVSPYSFGIAWYW